MTQEEQAKEIGKFLELRTKFTELKNLMTARIFDQNNGHEESALESVYWTTRQLSKIENDFNTIYFPNITNQRLGKV